MTSTNNLTCNILYNALKSIPGLTFVSIYDLKEVLGDTGYYYAVNIDNSQYRILGFTGSKSRLILEKFTIDDNGDYIDPQVLEYLDNLPEADWGIIVDWIRDDRQLK